MTVWEMRPLFKEWQQRPEADPWGQYFAGLSDAELLDQIHCTGQEYENAYGRAITSDEVDDVLVEEILSQLEKCEQEWQRRVDVANVSADTQLLHA